MLGIDSIAKITLRKKLITAFLLVSLLPLLMLGLVNERSIRHELTRDAKERLTAHANLTASNIDDYFNSNLNAIRTESKLPVFAEFLKLPANEQIVAATARKVRENLRTLRLRDHVNVFSYALLNIHGATVADTNLAKLRHNMSDHEAFRRPLETGLPYISAVEVSTHPFGEASLHLSTPVRDASGNSIGVLVAHHRPALLQRLIAEHTDIAGSGSFAVLLDEHHIRLAHGAEPDLVFKSVIALEPEKLSELQSLGRLPSGTAAEHATDIRELEHGIRNAAIDPYFTTRMAGVSGQYIATVASLRTSPWLVVFAEAQSSFEAPVKIQTSNTIRFALLIAALAIMAAFGAAHTLSRPIIRLKTVAEKIADGDLTARINVEANDEIGELAASFNHMTLSVQQRNVERERAEQALRTAHNELEARVTERTAALALSVEEAERAREELHQSEVRFRDFADAASDWYWEMDEQLRFSYFSALFERIPGVALDQLLGKTREDTGIPGVDDKAWEEHLANLSERRPFRAFVHPRTKPDGRVVWLSINGIPQFDPQGEFRGYRGTGSDVTEHIRMEEVLLRNERLAAVGQLTATVAHELRNPLGSIRSAIAVLRKLGRAESEMAANSLDIADRSVSRCDGIVEDLLDFSRTGVLQQTDCLIDEWLQGVLAEYPLPSGIILKSCIEPGVKSQIDPTRLRRALINLLDNACHSMVAESNEDTESKEGELRVTSRLSEDAVLIDIEDNGRGIPEHLLSEIFEPLFTTKNFGAGLGLAIVRQIVEQHDGKVKVESGLGEGACFTICLPRGQPETSESTDTRSAL